MGLQSIKSMQCFAMLVVVAFGERANRKEVTITVEETVAIAKKC